MTQKENRLEFPSLFSLVGDGGPDWNTPYKLRTLRNLLAALPDPDTSPPEKSQRTARRRAKRLRQDQISELVASYEAGATQRQLGSQFGVDRRTVSDILKRNGVTPRWRRLSEEDVDQAERLYGRGLSLARIADRLKVDPETVRLRLRKRGVQMRDPHERT